MASEMEHEASAEIPNRYGLHARPAAELVKTANQFKSEVWVRKDDLEVNGKSIMGVMMLAAECGSEIFVRAEGEDAVAAVESIIALVKSGFGEE